MNRLTYYRIVGLFLLALCLGCEKKNGAESSSGGVSLQGDQWIKNLKSNYETIPYFKFSTGDTVAHPSGDNWDICFQGAQLKINGGSMTSPLREGAAKGIIINTGYNAIYDIPNLSGLQQDNGTEGYALGYQNGGKSWYYMDENLFYIPYAEKTIFIQTADQKGFAKVQIISYYRDIPNLKGETYESMQTRTGYYTFKYQYIERGQRFQ